MSKEKLRFVIGGKPVVYEGRPENRPKDLMDILVKLDADNNVVVQAFRDNIEGGQNTPSADILQRYSDAKRAYMEKKQKKKQSESAAAEKPVEEKPVDEKPQTMTLTFQGKQLSYQGLPSGKQHAVIELLVKHDASLEVAVETFKKNLPNSSLSGDEIWSMLVAAKEAKAARKAAKMKDAGDAGRQESRQTAEQQQQPSRPRAAAMEAIEEYTSMTLEERDSISNFIKQVLEQPDLDLSTRLRSEPGTGTGVSVPKPNTTGGVAGTDDDGLQAGSRTMRGKVAVYCQEENNTANKVLHIAPGTTFEEFTGMVEKKFGRKMAMSFYEGEDIIDMDDDDVFCMFVEMSQAQAQEGKRMKLICVPPEKRPVVADDAITEVKAETVTADTAGTTTGFKVKPFSNGRVEVRELKTYTGHTSAVYCCAFAPKGDRFCTASRDRSVRVWNTSSGTSSVMKGGHNGFVLSCDFSPRGNRVVSSSDDRTIKVWNVATCGKVYTLKGHEDKVYCVKYNSNGDYIVSCSCDHTVRVWNGNTGTKVGTYRGHTLAVFYCCFSNTDSGKYVVSGGDDRVIKVWEWERDEEQVSLDGHTDTVWSCQFSHDDTRIVSAAMNHEVRVWDWCNNSCVLSWRGHQVPIHQAMFSTSDKYIYTCARDWSVMIWDAQTGEHCETLVGHHSTVYHMDMCGNKLITSSLDDHLKLWSVNED
ncbi:WD domain, G-beta repeat, putative [Trypanosoma equiperdum]|uniref:WD domain, G-beta repeat, putative n=1 Tax=Trypanosoma equiperdum TaxID=5694 RepID=A0A1G4IIL2_TRYEQ|nr:WD domain, G-beta repeat, putative [Trypanosoma equiperdum]